MSQRFQLALVICSALFLIGCSSASKKPDPIAFTSDALAATAPAKITLVEKGSPAEKNAIEQFKVFNSDFSKSNIVQRTKEVYAADVYFRDPFKEIHGEPDFEAYLLRGAGSVRDFSMDWLDVSESHGDYYFRWTMSVTLKRDSADVPPTRVSGISHVRFGADGKVVFHQDYFDGAALIYEKVPVMGSVIRWIKKRI